MFLPTDIKLEPADTDVTQDAVVNVIFPYSSSLSEHERKVFVMKNAAELELNDKLTAELVEVKAIKSADVQGKYQQGCLVENKPTRLESHEVDVSQLCGMEAAIEKVVRLAPQVPAPLDGRTETEEQKCDRQCTKHVTLAAQSENKEQHEVEMREENAHIIDGTAAERGKCHMSETEEEMVQKLAAKCATKKKRRRTPTEEQIRAHNATRRARYAARRAELYAQAKQQEMEIQEKMAHGVVVDEVKECHEMEAVKVQRLAAICATKKKRRRTPTEEQIRAHNATRRARYAARRAELHAQMELQCQLELQEEMAQRLATVADGMKDCLKMETEEEIARRLAARTARFKKRKAVYRAKRRALRKKCLKIKAQTEEQRTLERMKQKKYREMKRAKWRSLLQQNGYNKPPTSRPPRREKQAMPQVHWLNVGESSENGNDVAVDPDNSGELYVYKVDKAELACLLAQEQNKHVYIENSTTAVTIGDDLYPCQYCDKSFKSVYARVDHYHFDHPGLRRRPTKTYLCIICYFTCLHLDKLLSHLTDSHQNVNWKLFICGICRKAYMKQGDFQSHSSIHMRQYPCPVCGKLFGMMRYLQTHSLSHSRERLYRCEMCDKRFRYPSELSWHISSNRIYNSKSTNVTSDGLPLCATFCRPYQCQHCDKSFKSAMGIRYHVNQLHTGVQRVTYTCQFCGQCFLNREGVERHEDRKHLKMEGRFKCEHCHESFEIKRSLKVHLLAVHSGINIEQQEGKNPYNCPDCQQRFKDRQPLLRHIAIEHT